MKKVFSLLILILMISSCGFHLRGQLNFLNGIHNVSIVADQSNKELVYALEQVFKINNVKLRTLPQQPDFFLYIDEANFNQHIASIGSGNNIRQYQYIYTVKFHVQNSKGKVTVPFQKVSVARQITINNNRILGSDDEVRQYSSEMQREAAILILKRITRYGRNKSKF